MSSNYIHAVSKLKEKLIKKYYRRNNESQLINPVLARGYLDSIEYREGHIVAAGWLFNLNHPFDGFVLKIDNKVLAEAKPSTREDVRDAFPSMDNALMSGFSFHVPIRRDLVSNWVTIDIIGVSCGQELGSIRTIYRIDFHDSLPEPPVKLRKRVTNLDNSLAYWNSALKSYGEFFSVLKDNRNTQLIYRFLDWGCGCGRLTSLFLKHTSIKEIHGCDIDKEAICWCSENLKQGIFSVIDPFPPTPYEDSMFDVVMGYSVFTHLTRDVQIQWLKEIKRILKPGGLFITSVHGEFASNFASSVVRSEMLKEGISDSTLDSNLDGVAPDKYYRGVFQTKSYNQKEWSKYFDILKHIEGGVSNYQDLVIMQKENSPG